MSPQARNPSGRRTKNTEITPTELFGVFAHERRQQTLTYLLQKPGAITLEDLAEYIAIEENQLTPELLERICTDLYHAQLPTMSELGLVSFDEATELIELLVERETLTPYLRLANRIDS